MATKTISIDIEAYERLRSVRKDNESFSQTIKRVVKPPFDFEAFQNDWRGYRLATRLPKQLRSKFGTGVGRPTGNIDGIARY